MSTLQLFIDVSNSFMRKKIVCGFLRLNVQHVYNFSDPNVALSHSFDFFCLFFFVLFVDVINNHTPLKTKRVKHQTLPPWLNTDIKQAMLLRDKCRKQKKFVEYKRQRNGFKCLVRETKKKYFNDLAGNKADISSMWRAINTLTKGHSPANNIFHQNSHQPYLTPTSYL